MSFRSTIKKLIPTSLFAKVEPYGHLFEAVFYNVIYGFPAKNIKVIGVTGTSGKTSTSFLIERMLHEAGFKVGIMTTVGYGIGTDIKPQTNTMTTVSVPELMSRLKWMKSHGVEWLVLETTSHALAQNRVWGIPYSLAVMTNVTHEHLDYHKTFENYLGAKRKLFKLVNNNSAGYKTGIINAEDPSAELFASDVQKHLSYGVGKGDLQASNLELKPSGSDFEAKIEGDAYKIHTNLPGSFNVYNCLAAIGVGRTLGLSVAQIEQGIAALESVEGRMTRVNADQDFDVIVDFAHTPDSFEKIFKDIKPLVKGKLSVVFGSPGRRDETKRAVQGELAGRYCDEVIITEDDPRDIDPVEIMNQISGGAEKAGKIRDKDLFLINDRTEAIKFAINRAQSGDTVLLLGKGHEKVIHRSHGDDPWNEVEVAKQAILNK